MKKTRLITCGLLLFITFFLSSCSKFCSVRDPENIPPGTVKITAPQVSTWEMDNGLTIIYYHQAEVPVTNLSLYIPSGTLSNDSGIPGLTSVMVTQMREGGVKGLTPDDFDSLLDEKAASIETSVNDEVTSISLRCLSEDFNDLLPYYSKLIKDPAFDKKRFELWKRLVIDSIKRRKDSASKMASMTYNQVMYGKNSAWNQVLTTESVRNLNVDDIREMFARLITPKGAYLFVNSSLEEDKIKNELNNYFEKWEESTDHKPLERFVESEPKHSPKRAVYVLESDFEQANVILAHRSLKRAEMPLYKQSLFNRVLGSSGFGSLLFTEIREKKGLAYSVYGGFSDSMTDGTFRVLMGTQSENAFFALSKTVELLKEVKTGYLPEKMIELAKSALTKNFVFKFEEPSYAVQRPVLLKLHGYPEDYDEVFIDRINSIEAKDLVEFADNYLLVEDLFAVVVGNVKAKELKKLLDEDTLVCKVIFTEIPEIEKCF